MAGLEKTVKCCGNDFPFHLSDVRYSFHRSWIKTKKLKAKVFDSDSLRRGAGVNVQDDNGYTPLHHACLNGHKEIVRLLLSVDASPCIVDKKGATPLHLAAFKGDSDVVRMLLSHNNPPVNIDQLTSDHESALLIAAHFGYVDVVAQLMAQGADVTIKNIKDESALDLAAQYGRLETVQHLLRVRPQLVDMYKPPKCRGRVFSSTPLHRASKNGRKEVVSALIAAGIEPNIRTHNGTPLHEAACFGKASVVRILLKEGADLNAQDRRGKTVHALLDEFSSEASKRVRKAIKEYESRVKTAYDSEDGLPPFPLPDSSPSVMKAPETEKNTNKNDSLFSPSSSYLTKNHPQSFVKKLASKCLGLKAKFNSAPNIPDSTRLETDVDNKLKNSENKSHSNTLLIGNSKFFKILTKKDESGEIVCNDEFDTISLDRLGTLNRDSVVNRSNRSCPGFKTSLPNISENNELSDSRESIAESIIITELDTDKNKIAVNNVTEAVNFNTNFNIFEPRVSSDSATKITFRDSAHLVNECYESYEFSKFDTERFANIDSFPQPPPRPNVGILRTNDDIKIYENIVIDVKVAPTPALRTHIPSKLPFDEVEKHVLYENIPLKQERKINHPANRSIITIQSNSDDLKVDFSPSVSRSSSLSSDSMIDETNLEDIFLSEKSKSFRHSKMSANYSATNKSDICRTQSNASDASDVTEASAIENVDCSEDVEDKSMYLSMTGTLPTKKSVNFGKKKVLFRHKTFTNIEADRNSIKVRDLPQWNNEFLKETLARYHIRGTGHCIYKGPSLKEFLNLFNKDTLSTNNTILQEPDKRDSYFETAICFCRPRPPKHHSSAEDLLEITPQENEEKVSIDVDALKNRREIFSTTFKCFCDSETCTYHFQRRESETNYIVKFSAIKKSISTPDITLETSPSSTVKKSDLPKNKSFPHSLEEPYAVTGIENILAKHKSSEISGLNSLKHSISQISTISSTSSARPYSIKDIAEVISLNNHSTSTSSSLNSAYDSVHLSLRKSSSSEYSGHWSLQSCNSNVTIKSDASFKTCLEESSDEDSDGTLHSDADSSDAETIKSDISTAKRPWVHSNSFNFGRNSNSEIEPIAEESPSSFEDSHTLFKLGSMSSKFESGISLGSSESSSSECEDDSGIPRVDADVSLDGASLERGSGMVGGVRSGSGRRRWDEAEGTSEGDALSISSAASSCAPLHLSHYHECSKVSPTPPKKPPRRNLSVSPTHANSPSSGYSYELRPHARSQDDLDDLQGAKHYLKHGRSVDQYVDSKLSYSEYEENHSSPRVAPVPNPRPSLKQRSQPVAITAMYENVVIKEQNPRRKLRRNNLVPTHETYETRMNDTRIRKYSNQERSSLESLLDDQSMNSPSECERLFDGPRIGIPLSPTHYEQPPTPDHPPPSARQAENSIHERIRPLSQLIMEVVEEIRIRKKSQGDISNS